MLFDSFGHHGIFFFDLQLLSGLFATFDPLVQNLLSTLNASAIGAVVGI